MRRIVELALAIMIGAGASSAYSQFVFEDRVDPAAKSAVCGGDEKHPCFVSIVGKPVVETSCGDFLSPCTVKLDGAAEIFGDVTVSGGVDVTNNYPIPVEIKNRF